MWWPCEKRLGDSLPILGMWKWTQWGPKPAHSYAAERERQPRCSQGARAPCSLLLPGSLPDPQEPALLSALTTHVSPQRAGSVPGSRGHTWPMARPLCSRGSSPRGRCGHMHSWPRYRAGHDKHKKRTQKAKGSVRSNEKVRRAGPQNAVLTLTPIHSLIVDKTPTVDFLACRIEKNVVFMVAGEYVLYNPFFLVFFNF